MPHQRLRQRPPPRPRRRQLQASAATTIGPAADINGPTPGIRQRNQVKPSRSNTPQTIPALSRRQPRRSPLGALLAVYTVAQIAAARDSGSIPPRRKSEIAGRVWPSRSRFFQPRSECVNSEIMLCFFGLTFSFDFAATSPSSILNGTFVLYVWRAGDFTASSIADRGFSFPFGWLVPGSLA